MIVKRARDVARQWVLDTISRAPGFDGAFFHGSVNWMSDNAVLPATSDLDIMVLFDDPPLVKLGKFACRGVMLEVSYLASCEVTSAEQILGLSHMAGSFKGPSVICDPSGRLGRIQEAVSRDYHKRQWVSKRCQHAMDKIRRNLEAVDAPAPFHDQVLPWVFAAGVTTHVLLVAGLKNPTVRTRYVAVRDLLAAYGRLDFHEQLLDVLGCARIAKGRVQDHLAALVDVFDTTKQVVKTDFFFASDISDISRPIAIDGTRALIDQDLYREAVFWIVVTYSRCQKILVHDAPPEMRERFDPGYRRLLGDLGIVSFADLERRGKELARFLPRVWQVAEAIMDANPEVKD